MRAGLVQLTSTDDPAQNLELASALIRQAAGQGATFITTPEVTNCVSLSRKHQIEVLEREADDLTLRGLRALAAELSVTLLIGSLALKTEETRFANRSILVGPDGAILARYDKIHMFDVDLGGGEAYRESDGYRPGTHAVLAPVGAFSLGMTICYDLRFPALYRTLAQSGATLLSIPSAFTRPTGAAHWEALLRARAIECAAYVIAPAQTGIHPARDGQRQRETYGHSLLVDPWGKVVCDLGDAPGVGVADLDLDTVRRARAKVPSLTNEVSFDGP